MYACKQERTNLAMTAYINTLRFWMSVCLCVTELGSSGGGTTVVTCNLHTYYTLYCVCDNKRTHLRSSSWRGHNWGTAAEADAVGEQQLEQTQLGCSSVWPHETSARQRHYRTRLLVRQSRGSTRLTQTWWKRCDQGSITMSVAKSRFCDACTSLV